MKKTSLTLICGFCGEEFTARLSRLKRSRVVGCSPTCATQLKIQYNRAVYGKGSFGHGRSGPENGNWKGGPRVIICKNCGQERTVIGLRTAGFCSRKCWWEYRSRTKQTAGAASPTWRGGSLNYRGPNWLRQSRRAKQRDGYLCQHCGVAETELTKSLEVHHVIPFTHFTSHKQANRLKNLITLCPTCHRHAEKTCRHIPRQLRLGVPDTSTFQRTCKKCGAAFTSEKSNALVCGNCKSATCRQCGRRFPKRTGKQPKKNSFCSRECKGRALAAFLGRDDANRFINVRPA